MQANTGKTDPYVTRGGHSRRGTAQNLHGVSARHALRRRSSERAGRQARRGLAGTLLCGTAAQHVPPAPPASTLPACGVGVTAGERK